MITVDYNEYEIGKPTKTNSVLVWRDQEDERKPIVAKYKYPLGFFGDSPEGSKCFQKITKFFEKSTTVEEYFVEFPKDSGFESQVEIKYGKVVEMIWDEEHILQQIKISFIKDKGFEFEYFDPDFLNEKNSIYLEQIFVVEIKSELRKRTISFSQPDNQKKAEILSEFKTNNDRRNKKFKKLLLDLKTDS